MRDYSKTVYVINDDNEIEEWVLRDYCHERADVVSTPEGNLPQWFVRGNTLCYWWDGKVREHLECPTPQEAERELLDLIFEGQKIYYDIFPRREDAAEELEELLEDYA